MVLWDFAILPSVLINELLLFLLMDAFSRLVFLKMNFQDLMEFFIIKNLKFMFVSEGILFISYKIWKICSRLFFGVLPSLIILKRLLTWYNQILDFNLIMCFPWMIKLLAKKMIFMLKILRFLLAMGTGKRAI